MPNEDAGKIEILWGEAPVVLTRDIVFAAKNLDGLQPLTPGAVVLLPADAVLVKLTSKDNKEEKEATKNPDEVHIDIDK